MKALILNYWEISKYDNENWKYLHQKFEVFAMHHPILNIIHYLHPNVLLFYLLKLPPLFIQNVTPNRLCWTEPKKETTNYLSTKANAPRWDAIGIGFHWFSRNPQYSETPLFLLITSYSGLSNKRAGWNKMRR